MMDPIFESFLSRQLIDGLALAEASDLLELSALGPEPVQRYLARFACATLVRDEGGTVRTVERFTLGIWFPSDYLRRADAFEVATWLAPANAFLPNVNPPFICLGRITPGMSLVDLLYQSHEIGSGGKVSLADGLDSVACAWARRHLDRFPIDPRPLKRRGLEFALEEGR
jgi:hypothetical protein